jgi:plastocyanin
MSARLYVLSVVVFLFAARAEASEHVVLQKNKSFSVAEITIKPGDTIVFRNEDDVVHNIFSVTKGVEFNSNVQSPGQTTTFTFPNEGKVEVRCVMHPTMKLVVNVKK